MSKKAKEALANGTMTKRQWTWHLMKRYKVGYFMIIPFMVLFFIFTIIPVAAFRANRGFLLYWCGEKIF